MFLTFFKCGHGTSIFRIEDHEYDDVPNCWLVDEYECRYSDKGSSTVLRYANELKAADDESWMRIKISNVQKDYSKYAA